MENKEQESTKLEDIKSTSQTDNQTTGINNDITGGAEERSTISERGVAASYELPSGALKGDGTEFNGSVKRLKGKLGSTIERGLDITPTSIKGLIPLQQGAIINKLKNYLPTDYQTFIATSRYSRWLEEKQRREMWPEPVDRYIANVVAPIIKDEKLLAVVRDSIAELKVMPSMRMLMTAGPALDRDHMAGYNCAFVAMDHPRAFDEALYVLTCGTGIGFSCESQFINKLPEVAETFHDTDTTIVVGDSRIGWASAFREVLSLLWSGKVPKWDVSRVRGRGEKLKVFGGRASGPQPLVDLFEYCIAVFKGAAGRKLNDLEVHGIVCKIGDIVVVGGVRRSALISLSDLNSNRIRKAKQGNWWERNPEFALANNSAVYNAKPDTSEFLEEWKALYESKSGERGILNRQSIKRKADKIGRRDSSQLIGTNPCSEISMRNAGLCNLTEIVIRPHDTLESMLQKAEIASILGTIQSTYTDFRYVRSIWKRNAEEERLLGVSLTGIYDHEVFNGSKGDDELRFWLSSIKEKVVEVNKEWAEKLGINPSVATTCTKPSGTVSQLVDSGSGIHQRHAKFYCRTVRGDNKDPITQFMIALGVPNEPCVMKPETTTIFSFPCKAPATAKTRDDVTALRHLHLWMLYNTYWAEHQVSVTINVKENEWLDVGAWVWKNFDDISGISFLPYDGGTYKQAPYQEYAEEDYNKHLASMPKDIDWTKLADFEKEDTTTGTRELACVAGVCEI